MGFQRLEYRETFDRVILFLDRRPGRRYQRLRENFAADLNLSVRQLRDVTARGEKLGLVSVHRTSSRLVGIGGRLPNTYSLTMTADQWYERRDDLSAALVDKQKKRSAGQRAPRRPSPDRPAPSTSSVPVPRGPVIAPPRAAPDGFDVAAWEGAVDFDDF